MRSTTSARLEYLAPAKTSDPDPKTARQILLDEDHIRRTLWRFRFDHEFRGENGRVPIRIFAELCAVSPPALYKFMGGAIPHMRYDTRARVMAGISLVLERGLRWHRRNDVWEPTLPRAEIFKFAEHWVGDDHPHL